MSFLKKIKCCLFSKTAVFKKSLPEEADLFLAFDTETMGKSPSRDRVVQLAAVLFDSSGKEIASMNRIIKPVGFEIPAANSKFHGITQEKAVSEGEDLRTVLLEFLGLAEKASYLVAHNLKFDFDFVKQELSRVGLEMEGMNIGLFNRIGYCTMKSTSHFCKLKYSDERDAYKYPRLVELHIKLFGYGFTGEHNALTDTRACVRCFVELRKNHGFFTPDWKPISSGYSNRNRKPKNPAT